MEEKFSKVNADDESIKPQPKTGSTQRILPELCLRAQSYERDANSIPFHIPHKRLFEMMKDKKTTRPPPPEPLAGFNAVRKAFATSKQSQKDKLSQASSSLSLGSPTIRQSTSEESFYKFRQETAKILPHQQIPNVMDQQFWIDNMRQRKDQSFIYMTYAVPTTSELFTPYALKVVEYSQVNPKNFYSMSQEGVLQHCNLDTIFTPLNQWEYEYKLYTKLMRLKIFFKYRLWRTFLLWRKIIIVKKFNNAQLSLNNNSFILNDNLCKCLLGAQEICYNLSDIILIDDQIIEDTSIFYFIDNQMRQLDMILIKIDEQYESIHNTVLEACYKALTEQGFIVNELTNKSKKKEVKSSYIEQAAKCRYCQRLCSFIILIDYIIIDLLHRIIINSTKQLINILLKHLQYLPKEEIVNNYDYNENMEGDQREFDDESPKLPLFTVDIVVINDGININPSINVICDLFEQVVNLWDERMKNIKTLINDDEYRSFTNPIINGKEVEERICGNGPNLEFYLNNNIALQQEKQSIINNIIDNYTIVKIYLTKLEFIHQFHAENLQTEEDDIYNESNIENLRNLCLRYYEEIAIIDNLCEEQSLGIFLLKTEIFKETIKPETKRLIGYTERNIVQIGKTKTQELIEKSNEMQLNLVKEPIEIEEWVHYLEYIENANEKLLKIEEILQYTEKMYDLIEEFHIHIDSDDRNDYLNVCEIIRNLRVLIDEKLEKYSELIDQFNEELNINLVELFDEIAIIKDECSQEWLLDIDANVNQVTEVLNDLLEKLLICQKRANEYKNYQKQFKLELSRFDLLDEAMNDIKLRQLLWECSNTWKQMEDEWYNCDFNTISVDDLTQFIAKYVKNCVVLEKGLPANLILPKLRNDVETMKSKLPVIAYLRNPTLKPRHWMQIENTLNYHFKPDEMLSLSKFENLQVMNYEEELLEIAKQASSESNLEQLLKKVEDLWKNLEFQILPYKDNKDVFILGSLEEIQSVLDDSFININTITSSKYVGPIKSRVDDWIEMLNTFSKTLDEWVACQQTWLYLEVIFSAPDIQRQLPHESKLFQIVDKSWKNIMRRTANLPLAMNACLSHNLLEELQQDNQLLEQILKCLETYLEIKRVQFPRFYFLSNDELLEILAQTKNPFTIQQYLKKCFDAINKLEFGFDSKKQIATTDILAMISPEGERVEFINKNLKARGNVEDWLSKVEISMFQTLKRLMKYGLNDFLNCEKRTDWLQRHPNQIVLCVSQIIWAKNVHAVLDSTGKRLKLLEDFEKKSIEELTDLAILVRNDLAPILRKILIALITIDVHARDIISNLISMKIDSSTNFEWLKVLRYYWNDTIDDCIVKMSSTTYNYGYEYLGASGVLVITPLTDKCYLCLMGALQLDLGGAPAGPAGTGKTETTKDLSKTLAIQCVVFNCSDTLDYKMMSRFFSGLVQCGAWCCFDEFNRIDLEVLSVIAQQILTIRNAKVAKLSRFYFEGREIKLVPRCAVFITMNPGYAGRTELPDNLKALFRPISMMVPDYGLIAEVILYSEGFQSSKVLARKMVQMYKLCSEQLSQQDHYDFGMRAVKSVLVMAGALKRANPDVNEDVVLISALRDSNLPKFLADDVILFQGILSDLFPGVELPERNYGDFQEVIIKMMTDNNLQPTANMIKKILQLYETMIVRWGVMLVGPTGGGKSTIINILNYTLTHMNQEGYVGEYYQPVHTYILNPKAISSGELYGEIDRLTLEWRDGLMGIVMRLSVNYMNSDEHKDCEKDHQWIICDGPVDAVWIENLNTVLDDNKMLCLANSERIKLTPYVHMVFEVEDLMQASPATVSRCGMVYVDPNELKWLPYVQSWIQRIDERILNDDMKAYLVKLFEYSVEDGLDFVKKNCNYSINQVDISKVTMLCAILESSFQLFERKHIADPIDTNDFKIFLFHLFMFAYLWGIGGNLLDTSKVKFEAFVKQQINNYRHIQLPPSPLNLWSIFVNIETLTYENWDTILPTFQYNKNIPFFELLVPTADTVRYGYLIELLLKIDYPILLVGETGVGKTVLAKSILNQLSDDATNKIYPVILNFSAQTTSLRTQEMLELKLERKKKTLLSGPGGKKMIVFIDDVNMPKLERYGAQPPIELLRQYLDYRGLYDREKFYWKSVENMVLCAACAPPGGGRNPLTPRFVRHFGMLLIPQQDERVLKSIFKVILEGFFMDFVDKIRNLSEHMVNAAIEVYERIKTDLLPTPTKSHYVFNLRDLSKCIQGILQADSGRIREEITMLRLFYHECLRVFHDRLVNIEDKSYFYYLMQEICLNNFDNPIIELPSKQHGVIVNPPKLFFGDFLQFGASKENRCYEEIQNLEKMKNVLQDYLDDYNLSASKEMNLIFFMDAIEHCVRIARILRSERGNALLVGVSGMGKQSLTRLASHLNDYKCFQIELTGNYDHTSFFEDLRKITYNAGALNENTVFLFTDTQIIQEDFLEDVNNLLNSGNIPNLFESDEYEKVIITTREAAIQSGLDCSNRDMIFDYFLQRVRKNLHLVICMSPIGDAFRWRCRMFPSLVNCCTIDWFEKWPQEALLSVAQNSLKNLTDNSEIIQKLAKICVTIHEDVETMTETFYNETKRYYYTTPSSYLELLKLYLLMMEKKRNEIQKTRDRISNGLKKIYDTNAIIDTMKETLIALEPELEKKSKVVAELMVNLTRETTAADRVREVVKHDEEIAQVKADETQLLADDAQKDLDTVLPALEAASTALEALNRNDINEVKAFPKPPQLVEFVMESICLLLGAKTDWASAKIVLADVNFLKRLQEYDKDRIPESALKKLKPYIEHPDFVPEKVMKVSKACKSMCIWVRAIDMYAKVFKVVEPKRKKLQEAEREMNQVMGVLKEKQRQLAEVEAQIEALEAKFNKTMSEKQKLEDDLMLTSNRLSRAGRLNIALADEQHRWKQQVEEFTSKLDYLLGDILLAAANVAYLGPFTSNYRKVLVNKWFANCQNVKLLLSKEFNLINILIDQYTIRMWNSYGLPYDLISIENAIYVTNTSRWALMIDPQEQANNWIRQMELKNDLIITKFTDNDFLRNLELCLNLGRPVLLEEISETLDPVIETILLKRTFIQNGRTLIHFNDKDIEYDDNFKLYLTTKLSNPHYLPEIFIKVTIVNFTVTKSGLEDQLLADVVRLERPDLETLRTELIVKINEDKNQLKSIEDKILFLLYNSTGNILDDEELIDTLNESKETSSIIAARLLETQTTEIQINEAREKYRCVAIRGSIIYFVIVQLAVIDPMYQYSLKYFGQIFNAVIKNTEKSPQLSLHLENLIKKITLTVYQNISRGLFARHKLIYSFMLCCQILQQRNEISDFQWNFLLKGSMGGEKTQLTNKKPNDLITDQVWLSVNFLARNLSCFQQLPNDIVGRISVKIGDFHEQIELIANTTKASSIDWNALDDFNKLLLLKALKEEKLVFAINEYVKIKLGQQFIESPPVSLQLLYQDTSNTIPLIFILSQGSDPFGTFQRFSHEMNFADRTQSISLGQGQGPIAEKLIDHGQQFGHWIFLQNCHLATSWMLPMERIILKIINNPQTTHKDFRLYMSSMPTKSFPISVLQNSIKVTNEPPKGVRANMKRAFAEIDQEFFEDHVLQQKWRSMLFGLCMFHTIIQERKKFGPLGWNIIYEFNDNDRDFAFNTLKIFCNNDDNQIPWDALEYLTGEIIYGGRVTDIWDLRCLKTILKIYFSPRIFQQNYQYSKSGKYFCPIYKEIEKYREFLDNFPSIEEPELFGMHENANITYQIKETQNILLTILDSQPLSNISSSNTDQEDGGADDDSNSSDNIVYNLADMICNRIQLSINMGDNVNKDLFQRDNNQRLPSLTTVLMQEVVRYNKLLKLIHQTMQDLKKAIKGLVVMSESLEDVFKAFLINQVPKLWSAKSYNSLKSLGSWIHDLTLRLDFITIWLEIGHPISYWISGFYFPQGFLTGILQTHARKYNLPIDELKFHFIVQDAIIEQEKIKQVHEKFHTDPPGIYQNLKRPQDGAIVHGLYLDGGRWDLQMKRLIDERPGEINPTMPAICLLPKTERLQYNGHYVTPLYKTSVRAGVLSTTGHSTNFVLSVLLKTDQLEDYWILKGTALLTQITN